MTPSHDDPSREEGRSEAAIRGRTVETLSDAWGTLTRHAFEQRGGDGTWSSQTREIYDHGHAAACLAYDRARGCVLLTRQFRLPLHLHDAGPHDGMSVEAPAGLIEGGETAEATIAREMVEETGYRVRDLRLVADLFASPGSLSERMLLYTARYAPADRVGEGGGLAEEGEEIEVMEVPLGEARAMVADGRVRDLKTAFLILHLASERPESD